VWSLCQRKFSHSYATVLSQRYPTLHCIVNSVNFSFKVVFVDWQECSFGLNISTDLSQYLCLRLSLSLGRASLKCSNPVYIWGCDPHSLSLHKHSGWVCLSPSIHTSCRQHPWILVCLVHNKSLWLARLLLWVVVTQGSVSLIVHCSYVGILHFLLSYSLFMCLVHCWSEGLLSRSSFWV